MSSEAGFTLVEQLVAMIVGVLLVFAGFSVLETAFSQQTKVANRAEAAQRGRQGLENITQQLRSMLCLSSSNPSRAVVDGTGDQITFYADLSGGARSPQMRRLTYNQTARTITENQFDGSSATPPVFPATPSRTRVILDKVYRLDGGPIFDFHPFIAPGVVDPASLSTPLSAANAARIVDVGVTFLAGPTSGPSSAGTTFSSDVLVRFANPVTPTAPMPCT